MPAMILHAKRLYLLLFCLSIGMSSVEAAEATPGKPQRVFTPQAPPSASVRVAAKEAVDRSETASSRKELAYDSEKLRQSREIFKTLQSDPRIIEARKELIAEQMKGTQTKGIQTKEQEEKIAQMEAAIWEKEKELLLAARPDLKEFIKERERLSEMVLETMSKEKTGGVTKRALAEEIKGREGQRQ